jgi:predicted dehydrogenase
MTRLRFQLQEGEADYRAAASPMDDIEIVEEAADAIITDDASALTDGMPALLLAGISANAFPAFPWRFSPQAQSIRSSLDEGQLGTPGLLRLHHWHPGAITMDEQIAAVDLALWFFGTVPDTTYYTSSSGNRLIHLGFPAGGMAMIDFSGALPDGDGYHSLSLIGSRGAAYADDHRDRNLIFSGGSAKAEMPASRDAYIQPMLEDFLDSVRTGKLPETANNDYLKAQQVVQETSGTPST